MSTRHSFEILRSTLPKLGQIASACRELLPLFRGLAIHSTPTDADLGQYSDSIEKLAAKAQAEANKLLDLLQTAPEPSSPDEDDLENLFHLAQAEARSKLRRLEDLLPKPQAPIWEKASAAMALCTKVLKAATAIENAICRTLDVPPGLSLDSEIQDAIAVRQAYCKLWMSLPLQTPQNEAELEARLRTGATAIARLTGREIFLDLRMDDRRLLLSLQKRIGSWLASGGQTENGMHLWQDLTSAFCLLAEINHRIELLAHDQALIAELKRELTAGQDCPLKDEALRKRFDLLLGREIELDRILVDQDHETTSTELLGILAAMAARWERPGREGGNAGFNEDSDGLDLSLAFRPEQF